jgi:hypothetical protein
MYEEHGTTTPQLAAAMQEHSPGAVLSVEMLADRLEEGIAPESQDAILDAMVMGQDNALGVARGPQEHNNRLKTYLATHDEIGISCFTRYTHQRTKIVQQRHSPLPAAAVAEYTRLEGETVANIMISLLPMQTRHNPANAAVFTWFRRLSALGNTVDNLFGLQTDDVARDRLRVAGAPGTYAHLAYSALADTLPAVKPLQKPEIRKIADIALRIFGRRSK